MNLKNVKGWNKYSIADDGQVFRDGKRIATFIIKGYRAFNVIDPILGRKSLRVHREVALAHIPNPGGLPCVRHRDGDTLNCNASNLLWGTYKENEADKLAHGRRLQGVKNHRAKLEDDDVYLIRQSGLGTRFLSRVLGVCPQTITEIKHYRLWRHLK